MSETRKPGRPKGARNKVTAPIKEAAAVYTDEALAVLASIMHKSESDAARVAAANSLLDRGHGKPKQAVEHGGEGGGPIKTQLTVRFV